MTTPNPPKQPEQAPAQSTTHPETVKPGKLGSPDPAGATKGGGTGQDGRSGQDKDGNEQAGQPAANGAALPKR